LMQPLASAVTVCAVSRSAAVAAASANFISILPTRTTAQRDARREVPNSLPLCRLSPERDWLGCTSVRQWLMSKFAPRRYGDKMQIAGDPDSPLQIMHRAVSLNLSGFSAARNGTRPNC
jgi:hypothetical protein